MHSDRNTTAHCGSVQPEAFRKLAATEAVSIEIKLTADRLHVDVSADPRLADHVADNLFRAQKFDGNGK
jgi:hypothetical protein